MNSDYKKYIERVENNITNNPIFFYSYLKDKRSSKCDFPAIMTLNDSTFSNGTDICNGFADHFSSIYTPINAFAESRNCFSK